MKKKPNKQEIMEVLKHNNSIIGRRVEIIDNKTMIIHDGNYTKGIVINVDDIDTNKLK